MKKLHCLFIIISYWASVFGQKNPVVEYKHYNDVDIPNVYMATLYCSNNVSVYRERTSDIKHWEGKENPYPNARFKKLDTIFDTYFKTDIKKNEVLFYDRVMKYNFLISDNYEMKWDIDDAKKQILGYQCYKASTNFRGREWEVWFAPEIALPFGPWKLHGLPGLILEAHDASEKFSMVATEIQYGSVDVFSKDFSQLKETYNKSAVTLKDFVSQSDEMVENSFKKRNVELSGVKSEMIPVPRSGLELKYEWEE